MTDAQEPVDGTEVDTSASDLQGQENQQPSEGGNPAWAALREELDPISFHKIEPHLKEWDTGVNQRFEKFNEEFGWAREIAKQGLTPDYVNTSLQLADMINTDPLAAYRQIEQYLRSTGQLTEEEVQQVAQQAATQQSDLTEYGQEGQTVDPQIAELRQQQQELLRQQEAMQQYFQQQQEEQIAYEADMAVENEIQQLTAAHPEYTPADIGEIVQRAIVMGQKTGVVPPLTEAEADYSALRNRLLTAPRAGDSAPRLLPTGGGLATPSAQAQRTLGELSNAETQDIIAGLIQQNQG